MSVKESHNQMLGNEVVQALGKRNMQGFYCETKESAFEKALELVPSGSCVSWGGSQTLEEIGLLNYFRNNTDKYEVIDRDKASSPAEAEGIMRSAYYSDYYFMSSNAVTTDGKLINMDGRGNRLGALLFGPKNIIVIAGINKLAFGEEDGIARVKKYASPLNAIRLNTKTPCATTGVCQSCKSDGCICSQLVITRMSTPKNRIKVILVGENLGY